MGLANAVVDAERPGFEIGKYAIDDVFPGSKCRGDTGGHCGVVISKQSWVEGEGGEFVNGDGAHCGVGVIDQHVRIRGIR